MKSFNKIVAVILCVLMLFSCVFVSAVAAPSRIIDLVFVIDTTGSMSEDIYEVKVNMKNYLDDLASAGMDYRVAIVDYRDFPERTYWSYDYAYNVALDFSGDYNTINSAIDAVDLGNGGDWEETLYSALIDGLDELTWRENSGKAAIIMGDAPALDPEPITGYTLEMVTNKMLYNKIGVSDDREYDTYAASRAVSETERSAVTLFTIATGYYSQETIDSFSALSEATNGKSYTAEDSAEISEIISEIITEELPDVIVEEEMTFFEKIIEFFKNAISKLFYIITFQWLFD